MVWGISTLRRGSIGLGLPRYVAAPINVGIGGISGRGLTDLRVAVLTFVCTW